MRLLKSLAWTSLIATKKGAFHSSRIRTLEVLSPWCSSTKRLVSSTADRSLRPKKAS